LIPLGYLQFAHLPVNSNQDMDLAAAIQILSICILGATGAALSVDFLKARRNLTQALVAWRLEREGR